MAESLEVIAGKLERAIAPGIRGRLNARGVARAFIWKDGVIPPGSPPLGAHLTEELLSYGFGLLRLALKARSLEISDETVIRAFELVGESLESVVKNGVPEDESRGFYRVIAAASYHLSSYSARAYSLLATNFGEENISSMERALALLILRNLDRLSALIISEVQDPQKSDESVAEKLQTPDTESEFDLDDALAICVSENYMRALSAFLFAIRTGNQDVLETCRQRLTDGETLCFENGMVPSWWIYRLSRFLLEGLWKSSLQNLLPYGPNGDSTWTILRDLFVASLACRATSELDLWPSQVSIASRVLDTDDDIIASLPTSAGKTRIAELCILRTLSMGKRIVFVTPLRALSAQTERSLRMTFAPLGFQVSSLYGSAGSSEYDKDSLRNRHIVVSTPEKLDFAVRNDPSLLDDVGLIVLDEGHMIGAAEREVRYEVLVQRLLRRKDASHRRIVCLSAMLPSGEEFTDFFNWLRDDKPGKPIVSPWRPTRQRFGEISWDGKKASYRVTIDESTISFINDFFAVQRQVGPRGGERVFPNDQNELTIASAWRLVEEGHSVLIYCPERRSATALAKRALESIRSGFLPPLPKLDLRVFQNAINLGEEWLGATHPAVECLMQGIAVHHALLPKPFLREIDSLIRDKKVSIIVASPTLARGLNISASCVLFQSIERFDSSFQRRIPITVEEFSNVAGRAGRAYVDLDGQVLGICFDKEHVKQWWAIVDQSAKRHLESGLLLTCERLLKTIQAKKGSSENIVEYVLNNSRVWEDPAPYEASVDEWRNALATLDIALLSLMGDEEIDADEVALVLDDVLASSLFRRRLSHKSAQSRIVIDAILTSRAKYICVSTTTKQRRGYYFSGVGLSAGEYLDANSKDLNSLLSVANEAIKSGDEITCVACVQAIAQIVFEVEPFASIRLPEKWEEIIEGWLTGKPMSELQTLDKNAELFIEDGMVYRLAWALEAIRVRARANEEGGYDDEPSPLLAAIVTGTLSIQQAILLQAGLSSRVAAAKAVLDCPGNFVTLSEMRKWLDSDAVKEASKSVAWPTLETHSIWEEFTEAQFTGRKAPWRIYEREFKLSDRRISLPKGTPVFFWQSRENRRVEVFTPEMYLVGTIETSFGKGTVPWAYGRMKTDESVLLHYVGPIPLPP